MTHASRAISSDSSAARAARRVARRCGLLGVFLLPALAAVSCGGATKLDSGTDTSTNWLKNCTTDVECGAGATCSCGRCTVECSADSDCALFGAEAICVSTSDRCAEERLCNSRAAEVEFGSIDSGARTCTHEPTDYIADDLALCSSRELPECPPGSEGFDDACGCGCSTAPDYPRLCRDQCGLGPDCAEQRFDEFPDFDATRREWAANVEFAGLGTGECSNGRRFVYTNNGFTREARFFTLEGAFLGLSTGTDEVEQTCWGQAYWPEPVRCEMATLREVIQVGLEIREVGSTVSLPWAEGPPEPLF